MFESHCGILCSVILQTPSCPIISNSFPFCRAYSIELSESFVIALNSHSYRPKIISKVLNIIFDVPHTLEWLSFSRAVLFILPYRTGRGESNFL